MANRMLEAAGTALYGPRWQTDLSRDMDVSDRTMRRWATGDDPLPDGVRADLVALIDKRIEALRDIRPRVKHG